MNNKIVDKNARMALKQLKMEIAADYGMSSEDAFDIIENARNNGALADHFKKLEAKKSIGSKITSL